MFDDESTFFSHTDTSAAVRITKLPKLPPFCNHPTKTHQIGSWTLNSRYFSIFGSRRQSTTTFISCGSGWFIRPVSLELASRYTLRRNCQSLPHLGLSRYPLSSGPFWIKTSAKNISNWSMPKAKIFLQLFGSKPDKIARSWTKFQILKPDASLVQLFG